MYNNGFPASYQPYAIGSYSQYPRQNVAQNGIMWVHGLQQANDYPMGPNEAITLWDADNPSVYLKKTDSTGKPSLTIFDLVERKMPVPDAPYPTKDEFSTLSDTVRKLTEEIETLKGSSTGKAAEV